MSVSGNKQKNASTSYIASVSLLDTANYEWKDATTTAIELSWTIGQKTATLAWKNTSLTYSKTEQKPTADVSNLCGTDACTVTVIGGQTTPELIMKQRQTALGNGKIISFPAECHRKLQINKKEIGLCLVEYGSKYNNTEQKSDRNGNRIIEGDNLHNHITGAKKTAVVRLCCNRFFIATPLQLPTATHQVYNRHIGPCW